MKGILLISHGVLAEGMKKTTEIFFGENIAQFDALCLDAAESAESFRQRLLEKAEELDSGDGVIVLADLMGGTPCNQCLFLDQTKSWIAAGVNLPMVMECLASRESADFDFDSLVETMQGSVVNFSAKVKAKLAKREKREKKAES